MTKSSSVPPADIVTQLRSIKGVDTKTMMKNLFRLTNNVPPEVKDNDPNFIGMVIIEGRLADARNTAQNYPTHLEQSIASISAPLAALEQKRDARLLPSDLQEFALLKAEVKERSGQREQVIQEINHYIENTRGKFTDLIKKLIDKTPRTQKQALPAELKTIEKQAAEWRTKIDKTNATETTLQRRLSNLYKRISSAAQAATGMKSPPLQTPKME